MKNYNHCNGCKYRHETTLTDMGIINDDPYAGDTPFEWCEVYDCPIDESLKEKCYKEGGYNESI